MAYCKRSDPGKLNTWKRKVSQGVSQAQRKCPVCERKSAGGRHVFAAERVSVWRCRHCGHEVAKVW